MTPSSVRMYRRPQLLATGFTDGELARMRRSGQLFSVRRGVYFPGPEPVDADSLHRLRVHAAVSELARGAVVSHASAALLHGLPMWRPPLDRVQVTRPRRSGGRRDPLLHMRAAPLLPSEIVTVDGVPVTSVARTVVDLARSQCLESAVVVADAALALGLVSADDLDAVLVRCKGWPGGPGARRAVGFADGRSESVGESRSRVAIAAAGLPAPVPQLEVRTISRSRPVARVDFGWPAHGVVGEFDGKVKYSRALLAGQDPGAAVFREKRREDAIRALGFAVVRWTWDDLTNFAPIAARLRQALTSATRAPARR